MVNQDILNYIKKELARGISKDKLRQVLLEHGWPEFEINDAFEKAGKLIEKSPEEVLEEVLPVEEKLKESEIGTKPEEKVEEKPVMKRRSLMEFFKKIVMKKTFIIILMVFILGFVVLIVISSLFEDKVDENIPSDAVTNAKRECEQYCNSNLCGLFIDPRFSDFELKDKNCLDLGVSCLQADGKPKCEVEY